MPEPTFPATRRGLLAFGASSALALLAGVPRSARAQTEAVRRLIVGYPAGGLTDRLGRIIAESLSQASSARYIVENRPGADGMVATEMASRAEGDGRTLLLQNVDALAMEMALRNDPTFDPFRSLAVVAPIARFEFLVAANAKLGLRSLSDLIELGRRSPSAVFYVDTGSSARTLFENLKKSMG